MPTPTYDLIQEQVLSSSAASVTFSSIPGTYKDLVLEMFVRGANASADVDIFGRFNSDTGSNYSFTVLTGNGSSASSARGTSQVRLYFGSVPAANAASNVYGTIYADLMSYANTNVNKTCQARSGDAGNATRAMVTPWRSTSAVTAVELFAGAGNIASGSVFRLWGVSG